MKRIIRFSSAAFGMVLLGGLAYYQSHPGMAVGDEDALVGTALAGSQMKDQAETSVAEETSDAECDPSANPEDPDFENCEKLSQK
jgi:hypothetical protein